MTVTHRCNRHPAHHVTSRSCFALRVRESCSPGTSTTYAQQSHADWRLGSTRSGSCRDATAAQQIPSCLRSLPAPGELAARLNNARRTPPSQESGHPLGPAPATHPPGPGFDVSLDLTTRQRRFEVFLVPTRQLAGAFLTSLTTTVFSQPNMWRFEVSARPATPKAEPSSPAEHRFPESHLPTVRPTLRPPFLVRGTLGGIHSVSPRGIFAGGPAGIATAGQRNWTHDTLGSSVICVWSARPTGCHRAARIAVTA